jgi:hypothetical protein
MLVGFLLMVLAAIAGYTAQLASFLTNKGLVSSVLVCAKGLVAQGASRSHPLAVVHLSTYRSWAGSRATSLACFELLGFSDFFGANTVMFIDVKNCREELYGRLWTKESL